MTTIHPADFGPFTLSPGAHNNPEEGVCVMEMVSFLAGEPWSDMPMCSSPVIAGFCQALNDGTNQAGRDRLQTYVPRLIGTVSPKHDQERAEYLAWAAIRIFAPTALDACGLSNEAKKLRNFEGDLSAAAARAADAAANAAARAAARLAAYAADAAANAAALVAANAAARVAVDADCAAVYAARAAARAADATVADADWVAVYAAMFDVLDGLLEIGPSGTSYEPVHVERGQELQRLLDGA